jgi:hypothetical protein
MEEGGEKGKIIKFRTESSCLQVEELSSCSFDLKLLFQLIPTPHSPLPPLAYNLEASFVTNIIPSAWSIILTELILSCSRSEFLSKT